MNPRLLFTLTLFFVLWKSARSLFTLTICQFFDFQPFLFRVQKPRQSHVCASNLYFSIFDFRILERRNQKLQFLVFYHLLVLFMPPWSLSSIYSWINTSMEDQRISLLLPLSPPLPCSICFSLSLSFSCFNVSLSTLSLHVFPSFSLSYLNNNNNKIF